MHVTKAKMSHFGHSYTKCPILAGPICYARDILSKKDREVKMLACSTIKLFAVILNLWNPIISIFPSL